MRKHLTPVSTIVQKGPTERCKEVSRNTSDALTNFVDQLNIYPLEAFDTSSASETLKWTDLVQDIVYQIVSTRTVNTQHGQSIILSLQKAYVSCCSAWACGMLTKELLQNPMVMVKPQLFVRPTPSKTRKIGRVYNSYQLLQ